MNPVLLRRSSFVEFPDPRQFDDEGLVAIGGDLSPQRLLTAYAKGIFPWYSSDTPPLWWSPNPRAILPLDRLHVSRSLARRLRKRDFQVTWNRAFGNVMLGCSQRAEGTWIVPEVIEGYTKLHQLGHAHSVEVWMDGELAGGLYGVQCGALFAAESMFHQCTDASKIALVQCAVSLCTAGIELFDVQFLTPHLTRFGVVEIPRASYLERLAAARTRSVDLATLDLSVLDLGSLV